MTQDPIKLGGGLNGYQYVDGNPVSWVDPLGLFRQDCTEFGHATVNSSSPSLPKTSSSMEDILATGKLPGDTGVVITDQSVSYADLYKLSTNNESGMAKEILLVRQEIDGQMKYVIYSGGTRKVGVPKRSRPVAHTHPTEDIYQKWPSPGDMETINKYYDRQLDLKPNHKAQPHSIIWGKEPGETTTIYPGPNKTPLPPRREKPRHPKRSEY